MNEQIRSILAQETTKTSKIRQLYLLHKEQLEALWQTGRADWKVW